LGESISLRKYIVLLAAFDFTLLVCINIILFSLYSQQLQDTQYCKTETLVYSSFTVLHARVLTRIFIISIISLS